MRHKIILSTLFAVLSIMAVPSSAQVNRSEWSFGPVLRTNNFIYFMGTNVIKMISCEIISSISADDDEALAVFYLKNRWWIPEFRYRANVLQTMEFSGEKAKLSPGACGFSNMDWSLNTFTAGYHLGYMSRTIPLGFDIQVDYGQEGYKLQTPGSDVTDKIKKSMITGQALLKIRLLSYSKANLNPVLEIGGSYDQALTYKDNVIDDKDAVNSGFNGIIGLGFTNTVTHWSCSLRYQHAFYDYYDKDYEYNGVPTYKDTDSKFGKLEIAVTFGF